MKQIITVLFATGLLAALFTGCKEEYKTYSDREFVMFADTAATYMVLQDKEYFSVPVTSTVACDYDRTFGVEIIDKGSNAIEGLHYALRSNTITIKAGQRAAWRALVAPWKSAEPAQLWQPVGCLECRMTGYSGRVGIYEVLMNSPEIRKQIKPLTDIPKLREQGFREGMRPLRISGALKVAQGQTSLEEVIKVAPPSDDA